MILEKFAFSSAFNLRKQILNRFFCHLFNTNFCVFKLLLSGTVSFSTSYQRWLNRQWLFISAPCLCLIPSLIFSPTKGPYSKVGNSRMSRYENTVFTSNLYQKLKSQIWRYQFGSQRNFKQTFL